MEKIRSEITEETETFTSRIKEGYTFTSIIQDFMVREIETGALVAEEETEIDTTTATGGEVFTNIMAIVTDGNNQVFPAKLKLKTQGDSSIILIESAEEITTTLYIQCVFFNQ